MSLKVKISAPCKKKTCDVQVDEMSQSVTHASGSHRGRNPFQKASNYVEVDAQSTSRAPGSCRLRSASQQSRYHNFEGPAGNITDNLGVNEESSSTGRAACSNNARHSNAYRERLREDPKKWAQFKAAEALRAREYRAKRSEERKCKDRENARKRQKLFYHRKKLSPNQDEIEDSNPPKKRNVLTRAEKNKKQEYFCIKKRESRSRIKANPQQYRRQREKDAEYQRKKRADKKEASKIAASKRKTKSVPTSPPGTPAQSGFPSAAARRKAVSRIWATIPKDPEKFGDIIHDFLSGTKSTPRKQAALKARGLLSRKQLVFESMSENMNRKVGALKIKKDKESLRDRRLLVSSLMVIKKYKKRKMLAKELDVRPNYLTSITKCQEEKLLSRNRKTRKDATCMDVVKNVQMFYEDPKVSRELPCMNTVKSQKPKRVMEMTVEQAYTMWKQENPDLPIVSQALFQKLRPESVLLRHQTKLNQCLCEICTDILLKLQALNRTVAACHHPDKKVKDKYELIALTMCPKVNNKYSKPQCINRTCSDCGVKLLQERMAPLIEECGTQRVQWKKWQSQSYEHAGKIKTKKVQATKHGTVADLLKELYEETETLSKHVFVANWQHDMFVSIRAKLPQYWALMVLDFAENYSCLSQDEIQAAHWAMQQVTVHPIVVYYHCQHEDMTHITQEALVMISEDLLHDSHAVHHFESLALKHLKEERGLHLRHVVEFTDGCSCQYKSRGPFADISFAQIDHRVGWERHFFGSRHGKGPSDGVSGVVKSSVRRAVVARQVVVNTADDMFNYCQANLVRNNCQGQRCSFFLVKKDEINRKRPEREVKSALAGTRGLHAVRCVEPGVLDTRQLGCFCDGCISSERPSNCSNSLYVIPWQRRELKLVVSPDDTNQAVPVDVHNLGEEILDMPEISDTEEPAGSDLPAQQMIEDLWRQLSDQNAGDVLILNEGDGEHQMIVTEEDFQHQASALVDILGPQPEPVQLVEEAGVPSGANNPTTLEAAVHQEPLPTGACNMTTSPCAATSVGNASSMPQLLPPEPLQNLVASSTSIGDQNTDACNDLKKGDYVKVNFTVGQKQMDYIGKVIGAEETEVQVSFLRDRGGYFTYPNVPDVSWVNRKDAQKMSNPYINQRDQFKFD